MARKELQNAIKLVTIWLHWLQHRRGSFQPSHFHHWMNVTSNAVCAISNGTVQVEICSFDQRWNSNRFSHLLPDTKCMRLIFHLPWPFILHQHFFFLSYNFPLMYITCIDFEWPYSLCANHSSWFNSRRRYSIPIEMKNEKH